MQTQVEGLQQQLQSVSGTPGRSQSDTAQFQQQQLQDDEEQCTQLQQQLLEAQVLPAQLQQQLLEAQALPAQLQHQLLEAQQQSSQLQEQLHDAQRQLQQQLRPEVLDRRQSVGGGVGSGGGSSGIGDSRLAAAQMQTELLHSQLCASKDHVQNLTSEVFQLTTQTQAYEVELAETRLKCSNVEAELSETCARLSATAAELATSTEAGFQQQGLLTALQSQLAASQQHLQHKSLKHGEEGQSAGQHWEEEEDAAGCSYKGEEGRRDDRAVGAIVDKLWNDLQQERVRMLSTPWPPGPTPHTAPDSLPALRNCCCFAI